MKYLDEYRDPVLAGELLAGLRARKAPDRPARLMEICGTHTVAIFRAGLRQLLPPWIQLISGPGCPVCVTANEDIDVPGAARALRWNAEANEDIDRAVWFARQPNVIVTTFGDLMRVPGSTSSLNLERSRGADVRIVYATLDAVQIARDNPRHEVVFLGIGFETTVPTVAGALKMAAAEGVANFSVFSAHKLLPPAMRALLAAPDLHIDGFLCPGHVSTVIGAAAYEEVVSRHGIPCVVTGFEPLDLLQGITLLVDQLQRGEAAVANQYRRAVAWEGNVKARELIAEVFEPVDSTWRGLGLIPESGLALRPAWRAFDAAARFELPLIEIKEHPGCRCGEVLRGALTPPECKLFRSACNPQNPMGPCMVSSEGTCGAYYRYHEAPGI